MSDVDSEYMQFKEEFEKKEQEYRQRIHTLKKEVSNAKESLSKIGNDANEGRGRIDSRDTLYQFLDDEARAKVNLKDVKIGLLKEHIDKAKAKQIELLKGPIKTLNRESDALLLQILKAKMSYERMDSKLESDRKRLDRYYDIQEFDAIGSDLISRDVCAIDSVLLAKDRRKNTARVESNILFVTRTASKKLMEKKNAESDLNEHY